MRNKRSLFCDGSELIIFYLIMSNLICFHVFGCIVATVEVKKKKKATDLFLP